MFGFGKKNSFLGIDIGTSAIKILEIKIKNNKPVLSNYAWMRIGRNENEAAASLADGMFSGYLKKMIAEAGAESKNAFISIPSFGGLITTIELPEMEEKDIEQAIRFEAHKYIPTPLEDTVLSWDVVKKAADGGKVMQILLAAAPRSKVKKYDSIIRGAGLDIKSIEIESFSLARSLLGNDKGKFIIVDIGSRVCNIILVEAGIIKANMNIDAGGRDITRVISKTMGIDNDRAEKIKVSKKDFFNKESALSFPVLDLIIEEIKRVLSAHYKNEADKKIDALVLSGGTAMFSGIDAYFSRSLGVKTVIGNPLGRIEYDQRLDRKLGEIKSQLSVCAGLALKGAEEYLSR